MSEGYKSFLAIRGLSSVFVMVLGSDVRAVVSLGERTEREKATADLLQIVAVQKAGCRAE
jgi:hypothetical protein